MFVTDIVEIDKKKSKVYIDNELFYCVTFKNINASYLAFIIYIQTIPLLRPSLKYPGYPTLLS